MLTILNALLLACAKSSIGSMQVGFLMALAGVPLTLRELSGNVRYWLRTRVPHACQLAESATKSDPGKTPELIKVFFYGTNVIEVDPLNHTSISNSPVGVVLSNNTWDSIM